MFQKTNIKLSPLEIKIRIVKLFLLTSPLIASSILSHNNINSPLSCPILAFTGIPCPSCGLTRSFLSLTKGNLYQSFSYHLFGPFIYVSLIIFSTHLLLEIYHQKKIKNKYIAFLSIKATQYLILLSFFTYYVLRLLILYFQGDLMKNFQHSPLAILLYKLLL